jgi:hypothetical protein
MFPCTSLAITDDAYTVMSPSRCKSLSALRRTTTADLDELEVEGFDLGEDAVESGLVRQPAGQNGLAAIFTRGEAGERPAEARAQNTANPDLVLRLLRQLTHAGSIVVDGMRPHRPDRTMDGPDGAGEAQSDPDTATRGSSRRGRPGGLQA